MLFLEVFLFTDFDVLCIVFEILKKIGFVMGFSLFSYFFVFFRSLLSLLVKDKEQKLMKTY